MHNNCLCLAWIHWPKMVCNVKSFYFAERNVTLFGGIILNVRTYLRALRNVVSSMEHRKHVGTQSREHRVRLARKISTTRAKKRPILLNRLFCLSFGILCLYFWLFLVSIFTFLRFTWNVFFSGRLEKAIFLIVLRTGVPRQRRGSVSCVWVSKSACVCGRERECVCKRERERGRESWGVGINLD